MNQDLSDFLDETHAAETLDEHPELGVTRDLLVFEYGKERYAVAAEQVDAVVSWREPAPIPGAPAHIRGVIQDRGRIVVLLAHPNGQATRDTTEQRRVIICKTERGFLGLPATVTNSVASVQLREELTRTSLHDSAFGPFTFLDPERWLQEH